MAAMWERKRQDKQQNQIKTVGTTYDQSSLSTYLKT